MNDNSPAIPILPTVAKLAADTDAWIVDVWGVIHNGVDVFHDACAACERFRTDEGGTVILVSNAPRPYTGVEAQLDGMGVPRSAYDAIITSGDVTRGLLTANAARLIFHLGPDRDKPVFDGLDLTLTGAERAEVIACTGLFDDATETPDDYADMLADFAARSALMICANPDLKVEKGDAVLYCAGALAETYAELGGEVQLAGKPYPPIYEMAFERIAKIRGAGVAKPGILAIGDGVNTDIRGAATMGLRSLFIPSRVNMASSRDVTEADISKAFASLGFHPIAAQLGLKW